MKIVLSTNGFDLPVQVIVRYNELLGRNVYFYEKINYISRRFYKIDAKDFTYNTFVFLCDYGESFELTSKSFFDQMFRPNRVERNDPALVQVVEEFGNGNYDLYIVEIPDDIIGWYVVESETSGQEYIHEEHRVWSVDGRIE